MNPRILIVWAYVFAALIASVCWSAYTAHAAQVCTDAVEFQQFALSHKAKSTEIDNLSKQIQLYIKNTGNLKEQNSLLKKEVVLLQEAVDEQKKLSNSCEVLIDEHKKVLAEAVEALEDAKRESWIKTGRDIGIGIVGTVIAYRIPWAKWGRVGKW